MVPRYFTAEQTGKIALGLLMKVLRIFRPKINQKIAYNGHKQTHGIKFQSLPLANGLIGNLSGPYVGKRDDSTMSHEPRLLSNLQRSVLA